VPPAATVPPLREILPEPATAVTVPPHVFASPFGEATTIPVGSVSVTATPVCATVLAAGFVIVKVKALLAFRPIVAGLNALAIEG
jgi:hypothetical protein